MKKIQLYLLLGIIAFSTGCPKYKPKVDFKNPGSFVNKLNEHIKNEYERYNCYRLSLAYPCPAGGQSALPEGPAKAKIIRNELLEDALPYIDNSYMDFITDLQAGRDRTNFVADLVELGASAAVGITNGERPLQIIGVGLTAFRGGRRSADLNFYKEQTTPVLINKMDGNRAKVRATILTREKEGIDTYPIGAAISDIVDYYNAGTLVRAFTELQKDTAVQTNESEKKVLELKGVPITPEATVVFRDLSVAASNTLTSLGSDLTDATKKDAATKALQKIVAALEKDKDAAAALKNAGVSSKDTDGVKLIEALIDIRTSATLINNNTLLNTINQAIVDNAK